MTLTKEAKAIVPVDTSQWGELMSSEAAQRLPKISGFVENFRVIYNDADGNGMAILILQGAKAFVPVIVKTWKVEPIDIIVYKKGSETKYGYLSERTLLKLITSSSLGVPVGIPRGGTSDAYINVFSPAGGYGARTSNPWATGGAGGVPKTATAEIMHSLVEDFPEPVEFWKPSKVKTAYTIDMLKEEDYWRANPALVKWIDGPKEANPINYALLSKSASGEYQLFSHKFPEGMAINEDQITALFDRINNPLDRATKVASFEANRVVMMGNLLNREGSYFIQPTDTSINTKIPEPRMPAKEGMFQYEGQAVYIQPRLTYITGEPSSYGLGIVPGSWTMKKHFNGFTSTNAAESATLSRDDLLGECINPKTGDIITLYDRLVGTATVPVQILLPMRDADGILSLRVKPLFGDPTPVTIKFFSGARVQDNGATVSYPLAGTIIYKLSGQYTTDFRGSLGDSPQDNITVDISKGGSELFTIKENGHVVHRVMGFGEFIFTLIHRYSFSEVQALLLMKRLMREMKVRFTIANTSNERGFHPEMNDKTELPSREKDALRSMIKVASGLAKLPKSYYANNDTDLDKTFGIILTNLEKEAAVGDQPAGSAEGGYQPQGAAAQGQPMPPGGGTIMQMLANASPVAKATQEIIDQLTFYALGRFRTEEGISLITELEESLRDTENSLSKVLLLTQLGRIPGMDYSDSKILLSDIDSYLSRILSSRVLMK